MTRIKREARKLISAGERVVTKKVLKNLQLNVSRWTLDRAFNRLNFEYKNARNSLILTKAHKQRRIELSERWIAECHDWTRTIFTDEKKFNFDGPDSWSSWMESRHRIIRNKRQCGGGSVMAWAALISDGTILIKRLVGRINSEIYIDFLSEHIKPMLDQKFGSEHYVFQQDNASIHVSNYSMAWLRANFSNVLEWPARSPDLNPVENVWKMISDIVYDSKTYNSISDLWDSIEQACTKLMAEKQNILVDLIKFMPKRLVDVIKLKGELTKH